MSKSSHVVSGFHHSLTPRFQLVDGACEQRFQDGDAFLNNGIKIGDEVAECFSGEDLLRFQYAHLLICDIIVLAYGNILNEQINHSCHLSDNLMIREAYRNALS